MFVPGHESSAPYSLPSISSFNNGSGQLLQSGVAHSYGHSTPMNGGRGQAGCGTPAGGVATGSQTGAALGSALASVCIDCVMISSSLLLKIRRCQILQPVVVLAIHAFIFSMYLYYMC